LRPFGNETCGHGTTTLWQDAEKECIHTSKGAPGTLPDSRGSPGIPPRIPIPRVPLESPLESEFPRAPLESKGGILGAPLESNGRVPMTELGNPRLDSKEGAHGTQLPGLPLESKGGVRLIDIDAYLPLPGSSWWPFPNPGVCLWLFRQQGVFGTHNGSKS
jgi:hypothetical protein